jgi:hypothetical protein
MTASEIAILDDLARRLVVLERHILGPPTAPEPRKPRECWGVYCGDFLRLFGGRDQAIANSARVFSEDQIVHFREVLPD